MVRVAVVLALAAAVEGARINLQEVGAELAAGEANANLEDADFDYESADALDWEDEFAAGDFNFEESVEASVASDNQQIGLFMVAAGCQRSLGPSASLTEGRNSNGGFASVRCCSMNGRRCESTSIGCLQHQTFVQASAACSRRNMRLCSVQELDSGVCCGTGCGFDGNHIWTMTPAAGSDIARTFVTPQCDNDHGFVDGDGTGGRERDIGHADSPAQCASMVRQQCPDANGVTMDSSGRGGCYCEFGMTGVNEHERRWRTCMFNGQHGSFNGGGVPQCDAGRTFAAGDGVGGHERDIGHAESPAQCASMVRQQCPDANGVTMDSSGHGGCYCEFGMTGVNEHDRRWQTCQFNNNQVIAPIYVAPIYVAMTKTCCWSNWGDESTCRSYGSSSGGRCNTNWSQSCTANHHCSDPAPPAPAPATPGFRNFDNQVSAFVIADGCLSAEGRQASRTSSSTTGHASVRCCSLDGRRCESQQVGCLEGVTYNQANAACSQRGLRLCAQNELDRGVCCGTGCGFDGRRVWTSTPAR